MNQKPLSLYDAVRIVRFPDGASEAPVYYTETGRSHLRIGDIGVVIGSWWDGKLRVESVNSAGAIEWQHQLESDQLQRVPTTQGSYCRRRVNETWGWRLGLNGSVIDQESRDSALHFARNVMSFARCNVELLVTRLTESGYRFANEHPFIPANDEIVSKLEQVSAAGLHLPIALEAWLREVGMVDLQGAHPDWPRSSYVGFFDNEEPDDQYWYPDPLVLWIDWSYLQKQISEAAEPVTSIEVSPDALTKSNFSGGGPNTFDCSQPAFDNVMVGQHGSFTLFSYLRHAFDWAGFPGFEFTMDPPLGMLERLKEGLTRL